MAQPGSLIRRQQYGIYYETWQLLQLSLIHISSIIIPWLKEHYNNCEVIAVCGNVGQKGELEGLEERAKASGASKLYIEDLTDEFVEDTHHPIL